MRGNEEEVYNSKYDGPIDISSERTFGGGQGKRIPGSKCQVPKSWGSSVSVAQKSLSTVTQVGSDDNWGEKKRRLDPAGALRVT